MTHAPDRPRPARTLALLSLAALAFSLAQTMLIPALGVLGGDLHTSTTGVTWTLTGYLLAAAIATPLFGRLGDMFGKRRMLVISLAIFAAGNVVSALSGSIEGVVAGRVLQGFGGGIFPLCFGIIRDEFPRDRVATGIGSISAIFGIGGGLGLVAAGVLIDHLSYHWIFWLGAAMAVAAAVAIEVWVPESPVRRPGRIDWVGALLLAAGLVLPLLAISNAHQWGWTSGRTLGLIAVGAAILAVWVAVELRVRQPLADVRSLASPTVAGTNFATVLVGFGMFGSFILIPELVEAPKATGYGFALSATGAGLVMLPGALMMTFVGPLSGRLAARLGAKVPLTIGAAFAAAGLGLMALAHASILEIVLFNAILNIGIALAYAAMANAIVEAVPPTQTGEATGFNTVMRSVGASLGSQVTASILAAKVVLGIPTDGAYTTAFAVSAGVALVATVAAALIPRPRPDAPAVEQAPGERAVEVAA
ncbi:MAG: MFS transporter [Solirubrobacteraceae bacterium]